MRTRLIWRIIFAVSIAISTLLLACYSNSGLYSGKLWETVRKGERDFVSLHPFFHFEQGGAGLDSLITELIDVEIPIFNGDDYETCTYHQDMEAQKTAVRYPFLSRPCPSAWVVDHRILNTFTLVFTITETDTVVGYVNQTKDVDSPDSSNLYVLPSADIENLVQDKECDVYGFHEKSLVYKLGYRLVDL